MGHQPTVLWCAWLAWSRFRVVIPTFDRTFASVVACLDATLRRIGGVPTYALTDNEKTVTVDHVAGMTVRNPEIAEVGRHYGMSIRTCHPADPESKGGVEATVRVAKRDLVPTEVNLRDDYRTFGELEAACRVFCDDVNAAVHSATRRAPGDALSEEAGYLHPIPATPFVTAFGQTRRVGWDATISVAGVRYSVPYQFVDTRVWAGFHGDELVVTHIGPDGPAEVARHQRSRPSHPQIRDEHYPTRRQHRPRAGNADEAAFLAIGDGADQWLTEAAAAGARRIRPMMADAVSLAKLHGHARVDRALGAAAVAGRFAPGDVAAILASQHDDAHEQAESASVSEDHSLQPGTAAWAQFGGAHQGGDQQ